MAVDMAAYVYGYGQSGDVRRVGVDVDSERGRGSAESAGSYAGAVDLF